MPDKRLLRSGSDASAHARWFYEGLAEPAQKRTTLGHTNLTPEGTVMSFLANIAAGILANAVFALLGAGAVLLVLRARRGRVLAFFGVGPERTLDVYLSSFRIEKDGMRDRFGQSRGKHALGLPDSEFRSLPCLYDVLRVGVWSSLIGRLSRDGRTEGVAVNVQLAPEQFRGPLRGPTVVLGGVRHNSIAAYVLDRLGSELCFARDPNGEWQICDGSLPLTSPQSSAPALILKARVDGQVVLLAAGLEGGGTQAAFEYLVREWNRLPAGELAIVAEFAAGLTSPTKTIQVRPTGKTTTVALQRQ